MNQSKIEASQSEQVTNNESTADNKQVCPSIANALVGRILSEDDFKRYALNVLENKKEHYKRLLKLLDFQGFSYDGKYNVIENVLKTPKDFPEFERHVSEMRELLSEMKLLMALVRREAPQNKI